MEDRRRFRKPRSKGRGRNGKHVDLDYKKVETLKPFVDDFGRIRPRRQTRLDSATQARLAREVKRARHLALMPFVDG